MNQIVKGHVIFDHDGTLVKVGRDGMLLFPGMLDLLLQLRAECFELHLWTARPRTSTLESLKKNQVAHFFTTIYCADDGLCKPHPMGIAKIVADSEKEKVIHIGDSMTDWEGARHFGVDFIYAAWNDYEMGKFFQNHTPHVAFTLLECKKIIDKKFN